MVDIFISYTHKDERWATWMAWHLRARQYNVSFQPWSIRPGEQWPSKVVQAITEAKHLIAVVTDDYFASEFAQFELTTALNMDLGAAKRKVIPIRVADCQLSTALHGRVAIDLFGLDEPSALERLLEGVLEEASIPTEAPPFPGAPPRLPDSPPPPFPPSSPPDGTPEPPNGPLLQFGLVTLLLIVALFGLSILGARQELIALRPWQLAFVTTCALLFAVYKFLVFLGFRRALHLDELGRDLSWESLAIGAVIAALILISPLHHDLLTKMSEARQLALGALATWLVAATLLAESFCRNARRTRGDPPTQGMFTFFCGIASYSASFVLVVGQIA